MKKILIVYFISYSISLCAVQEEYWNAFAPKLSLRERNIQILQKNIQKLQKKNKYNLHIDMKQVNLVKDLSFQDIFLLFDRFNHIYRTEKYEWNEEYAQMNPFVEHFCAKYVSYSPRKQRFYKEMMNIMLHNVLTTRLKCHELNSTASIRKIRQCRKGVRLLHKYGKNISFLHKKYRNGVIEKEL